MKSSMLALAAAPGLALAQMTVDVAVGMGGFVFDPDTLTDVAEGTMIRFSFYNPGRHSISASTFENACQPSGPDALWSGYFPGPSGQVAGTFTITVNSTDPMWLYCATSDHCQDGMAMVINPPASGNTLDMYKQAAASASSNTPGMTVQGGVVAMGDSAGGSSSGSMMPTGSSTSSEEMMMPTESSMSSGMMPSESTGGGAAPAQTSNVAANMQAKGAIGAAAVGLLGALLA